MSDSTDQEPSDSGRPSKHRSRKRTALVVVLVVLTWLGFAAFTLTRATTRALDGQAHMEDLRQVATENLPALIDSVGPKADDVSKEQGPQQLADAARAFGDAHNLVSSWIVRPLWYAPVLGRQLHSVAALSAAAQTTAAESGVAFQKLDDILNSATETGSTRLAAAEKTQRILSDLQAGISDIDLGPRKRLVPPLARARNRFSRDHQRVTDLLGVASTAVTGVNNFLTGPNRYLVLASNNSEMRAGSGMFLQVGLMDVNAGTFELNDFNPSGDMFLNQPGARMDPDVAANWGWLLPNQEWRNLNLTPRFDESARMAADMWKASGHAPVDGVISVDVIGLQQLLKVVGPVDVGDIPGTDIASADSVVKDLLLNQYVSFQDDRDARRERLGHVAAAAFEGFNDRPVSASKLLKVLQDAGRARHILLWSNVTVQNAAWTALDASGDPSQDDMMLSVINRGGNKLDPFLVVTADVSAAKRGADNHLKVGITIQNKAPEGLPLYVGGPNPNSELAAGEYLGIVALTVPGGAGNLVVSGTSPGFTGQDGETRVATATVQIPRGSSTEVTVEFDLPREWRSIDVLPSARVPSTSWTAGSLKWQDEEPRRLSPDALS